MHWRSPLYPDKYHHPCSAEWFPSDVVGLYLEHWARLLLYKEVQAKLHAKCLRPMVPNKVCETPAVDPKLVRFLTKIGWNPKKGLESALKACQHKLLDVFGPLTKFFEMGEFAKSSDVPINPHDLSVWVQRAIQYVLLGTSTHPFLSSVAMRFC